MELGFRIFLIIASLRLLLVVSVVSLPSTTTSSALSSKIAAARAELDTMKARGCYVDENMQVPDIPWGMVGRLSLFGHQDDGIVHPFVAEKRVALRLAESESALAALRRAISNANCICDTRPCLHGGNCTNIAPKTYKYVRRLENAAKLYFCTCKADYWLPNCIPCCSKVKHEEVVVDITCSNNGDASSQDACELTGNVFSTYQGDGQSKDTVSHICSNGGDARSKDLCERTGNIFRNYTHTWLNVTYLEECNMEC